MLLPDQLDTPALVVDPEVLDRNITQMAATAAERGVALRPHAKTHKCLRIAGKQLSAGAVGLTVATLAEAEAFAGVVPSVFIAYPLWAGGGRARRLAVLRDRVELLAGVDGVAGASQLAKAAPGLRVLIEVDSGQHRTGVLPSEVGPLAAECERLGLQVTGAFTHPGHSYNEPTAPAAAADDERKALAFAGEVLSGNGPVTLSGGSTPTAFNGPTGPLTEVRPGTYVFGDRGQMVLRGLSVSDMALRVAARVVSTPRPGEVVLDAGSKALAKDRHSWLAGHGLIVEAPEATIVDLSEEHGVVTGVTTDLAVGDLVQVIPNHVCPVVNLAGELVVIENGAVVERWPVSGRR